MKIVTVNGSGDLAMTNKNDIGQEFFFLKITESGLAYLQSVQNSAHFITVPLKNVDGLNNN